MSTAFNVTRVNFKRLGGNFVGNWSTRRRFCRNLYLPDRLLGSVANNSSIVDPPLLLTSACFTRFSLAFCSIPTPLSSNNTLSFFFEIYTKYLDDTHTFDHALRILTEFFLFRGEKPSSNLFFPRKLSGFQFSALYVPLCGAPGKISLRTLS